MASVTAEDGASARHAARTRLNHIIGYGDILRQEAAESGRPDLAALFQEIGASALALRDPLLRALGGAVDSSGSGADVYTLLYRLIALMQDAKDKSSRGASHSASDADKLLAAANGILELLELRGAVDERSRTDSIAPQSRMDEISPSERPGRVLVVADDPFTREQLVRYIERLGHWVSAAPDGLTALQILREGNVDVALVDIMMPGMNGYRLLECIHEDEALKDTYVIVISALDDTQSIARCIQLGAEDYLPRQFEPVILKARIESCLEKRRLKAEQELYVSALVETQERLRAELKGGAAYVRSLLPAPLRMEGMRADWTFIPSASLGGDVFGYHHLGGEETGVAAGKIAIYLIDVSGHGIEAALYSVTLMNLLKTQALRDADYDDPSSVFARLNSAFKMEEQNNLYFTAWYGVWDPASRELCYASAGSPPALLLSPEGEPIRLSSGGSIIGLSPESRYDSCKSRVERGSRLFIFSDGIYEYREPGGSIHGLERFIDELIATATANPDGPIVDVLAAEARRNSTSGRFPDDVSVIEVRFE